MTILQASIPLFFSLVAVELLWGHWTGRKISRLNDAMADISCGVMSQMLALFDKAVTLGVYIWLEAHGAVQRWAPMVPSWPERNPFAWSAGSGGPSLDLAALTSWFVVFVLVDLCYYWSHRLSHEVNFLWAGHVVHHQSEEFNLSVAMRQTTFGKLMTWTFYMPLALIGVPWRMFAACYGINLVYQFLLHTRTIGRLSRPVEAVMNTPSHHRVHHGVNPRYQDRNYAGVFIAFDHLFGTFEPEDDAEPVVYGVTKPLRSWNPVKANLQVFSQLWHDLRLTPRWADRWRLLLGHPSWRPQELGGTIKPPHVSVDTFVKFDPPVPRPLAAYGLFHFIAATASAVVLLQLAPDLPVASAVAAALLIVVTLVGAAGVYERAKWTRPLEMARHATLLVLCFQLLAAGTVPMAFAWVGIIVSLGSLAMLWHYRTSFTEVALAPVM